jgi:hypothetical protein
MAARALAASPGVKASSRALGLGAALALLAAPALADGPPAHEGGAERASPAPLPPRTRDELTQLYAAGVAYGGLAGLWVHELSGGGSPLTLLLPAAGVAALATGATAWLDHSGSLTLGLPQALSTDALIGFEIAAAWVWRFHTQAPAGDPWLSASDATLLWSGATAGLAAGAIRYALSPSTPGRAAFTGSMTLWMGALSGLTTGALTSVDSQRDDRASLATAVGLEVGVLASSLLGRWLDPSVGWVRALDAGAAVGTVLGGGTYLLATGAALDDRTTLALGAAGMAAGLASATFLAPRLGLPRGLSIGATPGLTGGRSPHPLLQLSMQLELDTARASGRVTFRKPPGRGTFHRARLWLRNTHSSISSTPPDGSVDGMAPCRLVRVERAAVPEHASVRPGRATAHRRARSRGVFAGQPQQ